MIISMIIPVFNAEKYLERCMGAITKALDGIDGEIILIDNDSTDNSLRLIQSIAKSCKIVRVLKCHTPGASAVRNYGMLKARGKYVWFIDADDEITPSSISALINKAEATGADLTMMGATRIYADGHSDYLSAVDEKVPNYKSRFVRYGAGPWQFLIRREWWMKHKFLFKEGIIHEDMEMISSLILYTDKYTSINKPFYVYYQNNNSVLHKNKWDRHYLDIFAALDGLYDRFKKVGAAEEYHDELEWFFIWNLLIDSAKDFAKFPEGAVGFSRSRETLSKYFPRWRKNRFLKQKPWKLKIRVRMNYHK